MTQIIWRTSESYQDELASLLSIALNKPNLDGPSAMLLLKAMNERLELKFELEGTQYEYTYISPQTILDCLNERQMPVTPDSVYAMAHAINHAVKQSKGGDSCSE